MPLQDDDRLLIGRGADNYSTTVQELSQKILSGFTGDVLVDGKTLTFSNGVLSNVTP